MNLRGHGQILPSSYFVGKVRMYETRNASVDQNDIETELGQDPNMLESWIISLWAKMMVRNFVFPGGSLSNLRPPPYKHFGTERHSLAYSHSLISAKKNGYPPKGDFSTQK